jgi:very-short-patch-repair endonuclease
MIWNEENETKLKNLYQEKNAKELAKEFNCSISTITNKAFKLKLKKRNDYWSSKELELIELNICPEGRTKTSFHVIKNRLNKSTKSIRKTWLEWEDTYLKQNYKYLSIETMAKHLKRSLNSIKSRKTILSLDNNKWSEVEKEILFSCNTLLECIERIPGRTKDSIKHMVSRLGIKFDSSKRFTLPHQKLCCILNSMDLCYIREKHIDKYFIDCYLPNSKLCIEIDGTYWHKDRELDNEKNTFLLDNGYSVLRISENDITNISAVSNLIQIHVVNCWKLLTNNVEDNQQPSLGN